jgi:uncharacterized Zn finger protein (UPF0148 family)
MPTVVVEPNSIVCYCPWCGAYLFTLGATGEMDCDQCSGVFVVEEKTPADAEAK